MIDLAELISELRSRGIELREDNGALIVEPASGLTPDEQDSVRVHAAQLIAELRREPVAEPDQLRVELTAEDQLELLLEQDRAASDLEQHRLAEERERLHHEEQLQHKRAVMSGWDLDKVRAMVEAGKLTAEDVRIWHEASREREHRAALEITGALLSSAMGRPVTIRGR